MDRELMRRRIDATEVACQVALSYEQAGAMDAEITLPVRRVLELIELAKLAVESGDDA